MYELFAFALDFNQKENDVPKGIVKFRVEVFDQTNETLAVGTILTMVKKR
jgi:oxepin-CoA hydrolase/3-oxo-5,6-dehydrosuberyl-CoA semialdehyde dehydrogenase